MIEVFALDVEAAKNIAVAIIAGSVIIAILTAMFVRAALTKALVILVLGGLVVVMVGQRSNISRCAERIRTEYQAGNGEPAACTFLGREFSVDVPEGVGADVIGDITDVIDENLPTTAPEAPTSTDAGELSPLLVDMPEG